MFLNSDPGTVWPSGHARRQRADAVRSASRVWFFHHLHVEHGKTPQNTPPQLTAALLQCQPCLPHLSLGSPTSTTPPCAHFSPGSGGSRSHW